MQENPMSIYFKSLRSYCYLVTQGKHKYFPENIKINENKIENIKKPKQSPTLNSKDKSHNVYVIFHETKA